MEIGREIHVQGDYYENNISHIIVNSIDYVELTRDIQELQEDMQNANSDEIRLKKSTKLSEKKQQLELLKESVYQLYETFNSISLNTDRLQQAKTYFEAGKFREADALLNPVEIAKEVELLQIAIEKKEDELDKLREDLKDKSHEYLIKAQIRTTLYSEPNWYDEAKKYYEKILEINRSAEMLFEYATFLYKHNLFSEAILYFEETLKILRDILTDNPKYHLPNLATTLNSLGVLHNTILEHPKALDEYKEALDINKKLAIDNPRLHCPYVSKTLVNLGILYSDIHEYPKALDNFREALGINKKLAIDNPKEHLPDTARILMNLGTLHSRINEYSKALKEYKKALKILRNLAADNPRAYLPDIAMTLGNLGDLYNEINEYPKALAEYKKSLRVYRNLVIDNPKAYLPSVAKVLCNLGNLHRINNEYPKALAEWEEALKIYRDFTSDKVKVYLPDLATTLNNLGNIYLTINEHLKALDLLEEALKIREDLAKDHPETYLSKVAMTLNNLTISLNVVGDNYYNQKNYDEAEKYYLHCIELIKELAKENHEYEPYLVQNYSRLSCYYIFTKEYKKSEQSARQALELNNAQVWIKAYIAHALLFQNRFSEAKEIYKELSQTILNDNETYTQSLLEDFEEFEKANIIPEKHEIDVERIKTMLRA